MTDVPGLRRTKSLKTPWSRKPSRREEHVEPVPRLRGLGNHTYVEVRVTSGDFLTASKNSWPRNPSHRATWPSYPRDSKPGTYTFDSVPTLIRTPWELERSRRTASLRSRGSSDRRSISSGNFERLPAEVLHCIFDHLRTEHSTECTIDARALQADLHTICSSNKNLYQVASTHLYREIWTPSHLQSGNKALTRFHSPQSQLQKLLRTLKGNADLAATVRCIRVSSRLSDTLESEVSNARQRLEKTGAVHILSEIIQRCPNLEHFLGFAPNTTEVYAALARCAQLKSHVWRLSTPNVCSSVLDKPGAFMSYHQKWAELQTLVISRDFTDWDMPPGTISAALQKLPSLRHLALSGLLPTDFHNGTLLMLAPLKSLRLEELHGITDQGLEQLARSRLAFSLEKLSLCGLELTSLRTIQLLLYGICHLKHFTLHQETAPQLSQTHLTASSNFSLSSESLEYLHWDTLALGYGVTILTNSIASGRFPNLRKVKIPCDFDGAIQRLCRPISSRPLTPEDFRTLEDLESHYGYFRSLRYSQIHAQLRIRECRKETSVNVVVHDEDDNVQHEHAIGSYLGNVASNIEYSLEPAFEGTTSALAEMKLATNPGGYLGSIPGLWEDYYKAPDGTRELNLDLDAFF